MEKELKKIIIEKFGNNKRVSWNSQQMAEYKSFTEVRVKELGLDTIGEYCYYIYNNNTLPNKQCKCGGDKKFYTQKLPYKEFCSKDCSIKYRLTLNDKKELITFDDSYIEQYREFIIYESKNFDERSEYIYTIYLMILNYLIVYVYVV